MALYRDLLRAARQMPTRNRRDAVVFKTRKEFREVRRRPARSARLRAQLPRPARLRLAPPPP